MRRAERLPNLTTLGFLDLPDYEAAVAAARAVVVLTEPGRHSAQWRL